MKGEKSKPFKYWTNCVSLSRREAMDLLEMKDAASDIQRSTFLQQCELGDLPEQLGYERDARNGLTMKGDFHISYHRSRYRGTPVYYFMHSAIEYIFTKGGKRL